MLLILFFIMMLSFFSDSHFTTNYKKTPDCIFIAVYKGDMNILTLLV